MTLIGIVAAYAQPRHLVLTDGVPLAVDLLRRNVMKNGLGKELPHIIGTGFSADRKIHFGLILISDIIWESNMCLDFWLIFADHSEGVDCRVLDWADPQPRTTLDMHHGVEVLFGRWRTLFADVKQYYEIWPPTSIYSYDDYISLVQHDILAFFPEKPKLLCCPWYGSFPISLNWSQSDLVWQYEPMDILFACVSKTLAADGVFYLAFIPRSQFLEVSHIFMMLQICHFSTNFQDCLFEISSRYGLTHRVCWCHLLRKGEWEETNGILDYEWGGGGGHHPYRGLSCEGSVLWNIVRSVLGLKIQKNHFKKKAE